MIVIGVDCWALRVNGAGARYVFESLFSLMENDKNYKFILFLHPEAEICIRELQEQVGIFYNTIKVKINDPSEILRYEKFVDVFYSPFNNISFRYFCKPVVSVLHDVQERFLPQLFNPDELEARFEDYDDIVRCSTRVITISEFCRGSIIEHCSAEESKVDVVHNAPQQNLLKYVGSEVIKSKKINLGLMSNRFIFYPANFYPHKNHEALLDAYSKCIKAYPQMPSLVLMGMLSEQSCVHQKISTLGLGDKVVLLSRMSSEELAWLYTHCCYVVIPTLFEGFCLPAVEALAFNKKVLCSKIDVLEEVTLGHGIYFNPNSIDDISEKMLSAIERDVDEREPISINNHYDWYKSAHQTLNSIKNALAEYYTIPDLGARHRASFFIHLDGTTASIEDIDKTIRSILKEDFKDIGLAINISSKHDISNRYPIDSVLNEDSNLSIRYNDFDYISKDYDYYSYIVAGNSISKNYFFNIIKSFSCNKKSFMIGELHQVHEDAQGTFEDSIYFRINRENLIIKGRFFPEMFVSGSKEFIEILYRGKDNLSEYVKSKILANDFAILRVNFAKVLFKNSLPFVKEIVKERRMAFSPENFTGSHQPALKMKLIESKEFVSHINETIAKKLGVEMPPEIHEPERILNIIIKEEGRDEK